MSFPFISFVVVLCCYVVLCCSFITTGGSFLLYHLSVLRCIFEDCCTSSTKEHFSLLMFLFLPTKTGLLFLVVLSFPGNVPYSLLMYLCTLGLSVELIGRVYAPAIYLTLCLTLNFILDIVLEYVQI